MRERVRGESEEKREEREKREMKRIGEGEDSGGVRG